MKKLIIIIGVIAAFMSGTVSASDRICGEVLNTDIRAYINKMPIKSYNIDGWTGIVAEDLRQYGFEVDWYEAERELYIHKPYTDAAVTAEYQFEKNTKPTGSHAAYVYETDIKTYVDGAVVKSFNIGGRTIIYIDELQVYGDVVWNESERKISYTYRRPWQITFSDAGTGTMHEGSGPYTDGIQKLRVQAVKNPDGSFDVTGDNIDHTSWVTLSYNKRYGGLQFGISMVAHHLLADYEFSQLCSDMCTVNYDGTRLQETAEIANRHIKVCINDTPVEITDVRMERGNNHQDYFFVLGMDIDENEVETIKFEFNI